MSEHARQAAQSLRDALQARFSSLEELCQVLAPPLYAFDLIDQQTYAGHQPENDATWLQLDVQDKAYVIKVYWSQFQEILATKVAIDWLHELQKAHLDDALWIPFFSPAKTSDFAHSIARISLTTLCSILGNKLSKTKLSSVAQNEAPLPAFVKETCMSLLERQIQQYALSDYFKSIYSPSTPLSKASIEWQAFVNAYFSVPARVSNSVGDARDVPANLSWRVFYVSLSRQVEQLIYDVSLEADPAFYMPGLSYAVAKMARSGFMAFDTARKSFWLAILPKLKHRVLSPSYDQRLGQLWQAITADVSTADFRTLVLGLVSAIEDAIEHNVTPNQIKAASILLIRLLGRAMVDDGRTFPTAVRGVLLFKAWKPATARMLVIWISQSDGSDNPGSFVPRSSPLAAFTGAKIFTDFSFCQVPSGMPGTLVPEGRHRESTRRLSYM